MPREITADEYVRVQHCDIPAMLSTPERSGAGDMNSDGLTETIIGCAYAVANTLGNGFLEKVYENALAHELKKKGLKVEQQCSIPVHYDDIVVGEYLADLLVDGRVLVELKAVKAVEDIHKAQCLHYLKATGKQVCLLINFGPPKIQIKRIVNNFNPLLTEGAGD